MHFRANAKAFLITWSQVQNTSTAALRDWLKTNIDPDEYICCTEHHEDGGLHHHALVYWERRIDKRISNQWDYKGIHPNIEPKKTRNAISNAFYYCTKDGDFDTSDLWFGGPDTNETTSDSKPKLADGLTTSSSLLEFLQWGIDNDIPSGFITAAWNASRGTAVTITDDSDIGGTIDNFILSNMRFDDTTTKALVIEGDTGCGKTTWALRNAPRPALFVSHIDDLKQFRRDYHRSLIFDDMHFAGDPDTNKGAWPRTSQIHLVDFFCPRSINVKHSVAMIPAGIHKIFTCNSYPFTVDDAISRRVNHIKV